MIAMAAQCHLASAKHVVPVTIEYMEPFFKHDERVEAYIDRPCGRRRSCGRRS